MLDKFKAKVKENCTKEKAKEISDRVAKSVSNSLVEMAAGTVILAVRKAVKRVVTGK